MKLVACLKHGSGQMKVLDDWEVFFRRRYPIVGTVKTTPKSD